MSLLAWFGSQLDVDVYISQICRNEEGLSLITIIQLSIQCVATLLYGNSVQCSTGPFADVYLLICMNIIEFEVKRDLSYVEAMWDIWDHEPKEYRKALVALPLIVCEFIHA